MLSVQAEKLIMLHGDTDAEAGRPYVGNVPGNTRLNIPPLTLNDGPQESPPSLPVCLRVNSHKEFLRGAGVPRQRIARHHDRLAERPDDGGVVRQGHHVRVGQRCASLAHAPLPLTFSYKSEKSLCGTGRSRSSGREWRVTTS